MFVNRILRSVYFWIVIAGLGLLIFTRKGATSKALKIISLLRTLFMKLLDLIFAVFNLKLERLTYFEDAKEV